MDTFKKIFSYRMLIMLLMGYCAGLPLLLTGGTLQAWMTDEKVDLTAQRVLHRWRSSFVRNMQALRLALLPEQLSRQVI